MLQYFIIFSLLLIPSNASSYDYYKLSQQWPPTLCSKKLCQSKYKKLSKLTIHGLWPSNYTGAHPRACQSGVSMPTQNQIPPTLRSRLVTEWPNLLTRSDYAFWTAEWDNHGTCSSFSTRPLDYFRLALSIQGRKDLKAILKAANIVPKNSGTYPKHEFNKTIFDSTGAYPQLECLRDPKRNYHLLEIKLCLDHSGASYINCTHPSITCGTDIKWPL